jgi:hypothetical protein
MFETNLQQLRVASHSADAVNCGILSTPARNPKRKGKRAAKREAILSARDLYREAGIDRYDISIETRLRSIADLIASRRSSA